MAIFRNPIIVVIERYFLNQGNIDGHLRKTLRQKRSILAAYLCLEDLDLRFEIVVLLKLSL